jgi:F0F1-type ATP synthase assembly protein I
MPVRRDSMMGAVARYTGMAFTVPATVVVGYFMGGWLDSRFGTHWLYIVGVVLGAAGGLVQVVRQLTQDSGHGGG